MIGNRYGRWTVSARAENTNSGKARWLCVCDCGKESSVQTSNLKLGKNQSCGCLQKEQQSIRISLSNTKHGHNKVKNESPTHSSWASMLKRCNNENHRSYPRYGAIGIMVCERWYDFANFLADMGERPKGKTLDRYPNPHGNYEPGNCRWATPSEQQRNRRDNYQRWAQ